MKNIPQKIYLQVSDEAFEICDDFNELSYKDITWSRTRVFDSDVEYILSIAPKREVPFEVD